MAAYFESHLFNCNVANCIKLSDLCERKMQSSDRDITSLLILKLKIYPETSDEYDVAAQNMGIFFVNIISNTVLGVLAPTFILKSYFLTVCFLKEKTF